MRRFVASLLLVLIAAVGPPAPANGAPSRETGESTGLPLPRFVSLRADKVNLRSGPGLRYPIAWVFQRENLPVEVVDEFKAWRKVKTWDGTTGWVHAVMLQGKRTARVLGEEPRALRARPEAGAETVALLQPGAIGEIEHCAGDYCRIDFGVRSGWLPRDGFYGAYPGEALD